MLMTSKSILAKLLASENITVEHRKTSTAYFDTLNRVMVLPMWGNMTSELYDLLLGHETGHALYTPNEGWHDNLKDKTKKGFKTYLNVIEDVRIEKKIQEKFPGLKSSFRKGYSDLMAKDFFGVNERGEEIEELPLIDRINLHYKIGSYLNVQFSEQEMVYIDLIEKIKSWDDVVEIAKMLYENGKGEVRKNLEKQFYNDLSIDEDGNYDDDYEDSDEEREFAEGQRQIKGAGSFNDLDPESKTDSHFRKREKDLIDPTFKPYVYINSPTPDLSNIIIPYNKLKEQHNNFVNRLEFSETEFNSKVTESKEIVYKHFLQTNKKYISYLIKEFELRRNARQFARASVSKTGELDMKKIHNYKTNDDLFKRMTVVPKGKSHGLVMFIDYSGSMADNILGTIEQTLVLATFCRKVNIPFRVYAFSDNHAGTQYLDKWKPKFSSNDNEAKFGEENFHLREYISSEMSSTDFKDAVQYWLLVGHTYNKRNYGYKNKLDLYPHIWNDDFEGLNGTPLNETVVTSMEIVKQFKKQYRLDIVNTVFLTDGEGNDTTQKWEGGRVTYFRNRWDENNVIIRDVKGMAEAKAPAGTEITVGFLNLLKATTGVNVIGFYITGRGNPKRAILNRILKTNAKVENFDEKFKEFRTKKFFMLNNAGYDDYYFIPGGEDLGVQEEEMDIKTGVNKNDLKKAFLKMQKGKSVNRILLSRFVEKIA